MHTTTQRILLLAAASAFAATAPAGATIVLGNGESINLALLMGQGSDRQVIIDDKLFRFESFGSSTLHAQDFTVIGFISAGTNQFGLHNVGFDLTGPFGDGTPGNGMMSELNLQYSVEVLPEFYARDVRLCDTNLAFNGSAGGTGSFARVDETVLDLDTNTFLGNLSAYALAGPPPQTKLTDAIDFCERYGTRGYRAFEVNKDLKFFASTVNGFSTASFVRQECSQILAPAPGASALLALAGATALRRRRR